MTNLRLCGVRVRVCVRVCVCVCVLLLHVHFCPVVIAGYIEGMAT